MMLRRTMLLPAVALVGAGILLTTSIFSSSVRRTLQVVENTVDRNLYAGGYRIAVFGESDSWGAHLERRFDAYPYRLSSMKISNYAFYNAGPNYASVCTQTMVGSDDLFDIILVEHYLRAPEGMVGLAKKLKQRFPTSLIVFVKLWKPWMVYRRMPGDTTNGEKLEDWRARMNIAKGSDSLYSTDLYEAITNDHEATWHVPLQQKSEDAFKEAVEAAGAHVVSLPMSNDVRNSMASHLEFFDPDYGLLTAKAHQYVGEQVDAIIQDRTPLPEATYGDWGKGDACHMWFDNGACSFEKSEGVTMMQYSEMEGNFALEIPPEGGWIRVTNPFDTDRRLFLSYITSDGASHPRTNVTIDGQEPYIMDPKLYVDPLGVHPIKTTPVGSVFLPPGEHTVQFNPLEQTKYPFRLVGASFTDEVTVPDMHDFSPLMKINF